jgi:hypothetical protein
LSGQQACKGIEGKRSVIELLATASITCHNGARYIVMNNRDQLDVLWPGKFTAEKIARFLQSLCFAQNQGIHSGRSFHGFSNRAHRPQAPSNVTLAIARTENSGTFSTAARKN